MRALQAALSAAAFALLNQVGSFFQIEGGVSVFYPATAVDVVACMLFGFWGAAGVFLGCLLTPWQPGETLFQTSISGLLNVAEGIIPYLVFRARRDLHRDLHDFRSLVAFVLFGCVLNSAVSAFLGNTLLIPPPLDSQRLFMWWVSDFSAAIMLAMPLLAFAGAPLARLAGRREEEPQRTLVNAVEITATVVLLGWAAATAIQTYLADRIEDDRVEEQVRWSEASRALTELHRNFEAAAVEGNTPSRRARLGELLARLSHTSRGTPVAGAIDGTREAIVGFLIRPDPALRVGVEERLLATRAAIETHNAATWRLYQERRSRIRLVILLMQQALLVILLLASGSLVFRIARPLRQMHREILHLREGRSFEAWRIASNFVELRLLAETMEQTSRELRTREEALREQTARAVAASKAKSEFLAKMSHELRTPLNSVIGFSELILERGDDLSSQRREGFLQNILRSARHLLHLINDLLDMAKVEAGKMEFHFEVTDLRNIVRSAVVSVTPQLESKRQAIDVALPDQPAVARVDPVRIEQVLLNLLSNAHKFSDEGTQISIAVHAGAGACEIEVRDQGIGIPEADQDRIFEDFLQLHAVPRTPGTGLGLGLARRFVEAQGGSISVVSRPGVGSAFFVRLPIWKPEEISRSA